MKRLIQGYLKDYAGNVMPNIPFYVYLNNTTTQANIYSTVDSTTPVSQPQHTDSTGKFSFYTSDFDYGSYQTFDIYFSSPVPTTFTNIKGEVVKTTYSITSNTTVNHPLEVPYGVLFNVALGVTLTINGSFEAGLYQVFTGNGTVTFNPGSIKSFCPVWKGESGDIQLYGKAQNSDRVDDYHASQTPTPNTIPVADNTGKLNAGWIPSDIASNADTLDGYHASQTPTANTIPVANSDGFIDDSWIGFGSALSAGILSAIGLNGVLSREVENIRKRVFAQGIAYLKNKYVIQGFVLTKSDIRALHLSQTGTVGSGISKAFIDGITISIPDDDYHVSVPTNEDDYAKTYYAYLRKQSDGSYHVEIDRQVPFDGMLLYSLLIPANDTANNLNNVTLTDQRTIQANDGWTAVSRPYTYVPLPYTLPSADYAIDLEVEDATNVGAVGALRVYSRATNGFRIEMTGSADNVKIRWTLHNINYA